MNFRNFQSILFITICFASCTHELEIIEKPDRLIPADSMKLILSDLMLVESFVKVQHPNVNDFQRLMQDSGSEIFKNYNIDSTRFSESMEYYSKSQEELIEIYKSIQDSVSLEVDVPDSVVVE